MIVKDKKYYSSLKSKESRKLKAKKKSQSVWFGLGFIGLIGWSVVVPMLLGILLGLWLDKRFPGKHSWTLTMLTTGLAIGCLNAWRWINKENKEIQKEQEDDNE